MINICFNYLYRDYSDYKNHGSIIFSNPNNLSLEEIEAAIRDLRLCGCSNPTNPLPSHSMKHFLTLLFFFVAFTYSLHAQTPPPPPPATGTINGDMSTDGDVEEPPTPTVAADPDSVIFTFVEEMPTYGTEAASFMQYLQSAIRYPQAEKEAGKQGTVYVNFVVEKDGSVTHCVIAKGVTGAPGLSKEAIRVVSESPKWNPGKMNGRAVRVKMTMPVKFVLQ